MTLLLHVFLWILFAYVMIGLLVGVILSEHIILPFEIDNLIRRMQAEFKFSNSEVEYITLAIRYLVASFTWGYYGFKEKRK